MAYKFPTKNRKIGRPKGSGRDESAALRRMALAICEGRARFEREASRQITGDTKGMPESGRGRRLRDLYAESREELEADAMLTLDERELPSEGPLFPSAAGETVDLRADRTAAVIRIQEKMAIYPDLREFVETDRTPLRRRSLRSLNHLLRGIGVKTMEEVMTELERPEKPPILTSGNPSSLPHKK